MLRSKVLGCGSYLPEKVLTNRELSETVEANDDWIVERTGITRRHIAADNELTSDLAVVAAKQAIGNAKVAIEEIDLLILATSTPDNTFPATATKVQSMLGIRNGAAFDIQAVCAGFIYALSVADNFLRSGQAKTALVIGAETYSRILFAKYVLVLPPDPILMLGEHSVGTKTLCCVWSTFLLDS